jgi:hypothetical protein
MQGPIPPTDDENHQGQPSWCQNFNTKEWMHNCDCQPRMGDKECKEPDKGGENSKCSVYCRKKACRCKRRCEETK